MIAKNPPLKSPIDHITYSLSNHPANQPPLDLDEEAWEEATITAIALGLAPLLHWHLGRLEQATATVPPLTMAKLGLTRQAHAQRNEAIAGQLAELLATCAAEGIDVIILKGALLAPTIYPDPALRPMNDIDLLFRPDDLDKVGPLLERLGYRGKHKSADEGPGITKHLSTYRRAGNEADTPNPYLSAGGDRMIEPHGSLEESWFGLKVDMTPGVWQRAVPLRLHDQPALRLATPDLILHLAVHAVFHVIMGSAVFLQLYDLGQLLRTWGDEVDWSQVLARAEAATAEPFLYAALHWAATIFAAPLPPGLLIDLRRRCRPNLAAYIHSLDALGIFERTQQPPLVTLPQRLRRGLQDRREAARWAKSAAAKWKVWQTALAFHKTDTAHLLQRRLRAS